MIKDEYFTIEEVAGMFKVTYLTVYRWIKANKLEAVKVGKQYRIKQSNLDKFLIKK